MKRLINVTLAIILAVGGTLAGATAGKMLPSASLLLGGTSASAEGLTAQPTGPLTPSPAGSGFTYQGKLLNTSSPVSGSYDFTFKLYDEASAGTLVSGPISVTTTISNGLFTVNLDFGTSAFDGDARYMEMATRQTGGGAYTTLSPRQPVTPAPYALFALDTPPYDNVLVVAKSGGDFTSIQAALFSITDNSASERYLVWVAPGTYTEEVWMKQYVDIEGAGETLTRITSAYSPGGNSTTVIGASNAELRSVTVENTGGTTHASAINNNGASPSLLNVTAIASGGSSANQGVSNNNSSSPIMNNVTATASGGNRSYGVYNVSASPTMNNVTATGFGASEINYGVYNQTVSPSMTNVKAVASGGTYSYGVANSGSSPTMNNVTATGSGASIYNYGVSNQSNSSPTMNNVTATASGVSSGSNIGVSNSNSGSSPTMNNVTATASGGTVSLGVINANSSPTMTNVNVTASGGSDYNYGVSNNTNSSPTMTNVNVTASGGFAINYGMYNYSNSSPLMTNVNVTASNGFDNYGMYNTSSSPTIQNSNIRATPGSNNYGVYNLTSGTVRIDNSKITGSTYTILSGPGVTTRVGASQLSGGNISGGSVTCTASYNESYVSPGLNVCP